MNSKNDIVKIDETVESPRFNELGKSIVDWIDSYSEDEFIHPQEDGVELLVLGVDNKYKSRMCFMLGNNVNPIDSAFNAVNHGIGNFLNPENHLETDIFTGITNYVARVCIENPGIWNKLRNFIEKGIKNKENQIKNFEEELPN